MWWPWLLVACGEPASTPPIDGTAAAEAADAMVRAGEAAGEVAAQAAALESLAGELRTGAERPPRDVLRDIHQQLSRAEENAAGVEQALQQAGEALATGD